MDQCKNLALLLHLLVTVAPLINGQTVQNAKDLRTALFTTNSYDKRVRPVANQIDTLNISVDFTLLSINEIDAVEETLKTTGYLYVTWRDNELTWTPASYGGLTSLFIPQNEVWKPDIALQNSYIDYKPLGVSELNVEVYSDGTVLWYPFQVFISTCSLDIRFFPFDVQKCEIKFVAWSYGKSAVYLESEYGVLLYEYEENPSWELLDTSFSEEIYSSDAVIIFKLTLKRKSLYAMISVVFPILVLTILNLFVFVLPCESGEKSGYAVTVFLTFAVFLTIISATMPENSNSVPLFSMYVIVMTTQSTVITMIALAMVRCTTFHEDITPVPNWLITLAKLGKFKPCRGKKLNNKVENADDTDIEEPKKSAAYIETDLDRKKYTWKHIVNGLDAFCFMIFSVLSVLTTILFLCLSVALA